MERSNFCSFVNAPISRGMYPESSLLFNVKLSVFIRRPRDGGMLPVRLLCPRCSSVRASKLPKHAGILPCKLLETKTSVCRLVMPQKAEDMDPSRALPPRFRLVTVLCCARPWRSCSGIVPFRSLEPTLSRSRLGSWPICGGIDPVKRFFERTLKIGPK